jgi:hypothetical protein
MLSMWARRLWLGLIVTFAVPAPRARAQAVYGGIAGTVTDSSGAAVAEAHLTITSLERKTVDTAVCNTSGFYLRDRLLPGAYAVTAGNRTPGERADRLALRPGVVNYRPRSGSRPAAECPRSCRRGPLT